MNEKQRKIIDLLSNPTTRAMGLELLKPWSQELKQSELYTPWDTDNEVWLCTFWDHINGRLTSRFAVCRQRGVDLVTGHVDGVFYDEITDLPIIDECIIAVEKGHLVRTILTTNLNFWDRLKVLFGAKIVISLEQYLDQPALVSRGVCKTKVEWKRSSKIVSMTSGG